MILKSCLSSLIILINVNLSTGVTFTVNSPTLSIIVAVGEDAIINCYLKPQISAKNMEVRWLRSNDGSIIHLYRNGKDETQTVDPAFHGRTDLIKDEIEKGNVSLRIQNIRPSDEELYTCYFQSEFYFDEAKIEILPAAIGTSPVFSIERHSGQVSCSSSGWYPKPEANWLSDNSERLNESSKSIAQNDNELYEINITINFGEKSSKKLCLIKNSYPGHQRKATISLSDRIYLRTSGLIASITFNLLFAICLSICLFYWDKERKANFLYKEFAEALQNKVNVRLDPETAHPDLKVSDDLKYLSRKDEKENIPDNDKRFDTRLYVLGKEHLSANQNYWEVNVKDARFWTIGVACEKIKRKGKINLSTNEGFWLIEQDDKEYKVNTDNPMNLNVSSKPQKIGINLNLVKKKLIFYNVDMECMIHSFPMNVANNIRLFPFFSVWAQHESIHVCSDGCTHCSSNVVTNETTHMLSEEKLGDNIC